MLRKIMPYVLQHVVYNTVVRIETINKRQQLSVVRNFSIQTVTVAEANLAEVCAMSEQDQPEPTPVPAMFGE